LGLATQLNPEVTYSFGDMRNLRLGKTFDAVAIFDSINYMLTVEDLRAAFVTAYKHLKPVSVFFSLWLKRLPNASGRIGLNTQPTPAVTSRLLLLRMHMIPIQRIPLMR